ncbi:MAG: excinuclease ABC subunit UvrA, partial [Schleiferiaceae bacterium]|nr:excinuclease ABC subunit UvrA [Schleiferiaceae bacterium]
NEDTIEVYGARVHNLKDIDVTIPRNKLVVVTGLSGSGKSSLAFDTIYAEGQRRYVETFSAYTRQFLGGLERPDVDKINGLSPVISIEQKTTSRNPRSTVGTVTEIYDFLRLLYARAATAYSYNTGEKMVSYTDEQIMNLITEQYMSKKVAILAPLVKSRKGHYRELFEQIAKQGYLRVRVDGELMEVTPGMRVDRYKTHDIEVVVDRLVANAGNEERLKKSIGVAMKQGQGICMVMDLETETARHYSRKLMCPTTGISYPDPEPNTFSFNSPKGACSTCNGLGTVKEIDMSKVIPDPNLSIKKGGLAPLGEYKRSWIFNQMEAIGERYGFKLDTPIKKFSKEAMDVILNGSTESFKVADREVGITRTYKIDFDGLLSFIQQQSVEVKSKSLQRWADGFMYTKTCDTCNGSRLKKESQFFKIGKQNIGEVVEMDVLDFAKWLDKVPKLLDSKEQVIAQEVLKELKTRTQFLVDVGLTYLSLNRSARSLSGGEAQRIRLATQIGSQLVNVLYILDEPSIGLHQRDNTRLIKSLENLRDIGNSVLVVEHDKEMMESADEVVDMGPGAGIHGGAIVAQGKYADILNSDTLTAAYLNGQKQIHTQNTPREGNGNFISLKGAKGNNLKNVSIDIPLGKLVLVTGVSGSGKSTLINDTLYPILSANLYNSVKKPLAHKSISGIEHIDKVIDIDQSPIGRTPRSNPATYTGVFSEIRSLFANLPESKIRGYKPGRFSFNVKGGRCETCQGAGLRVIEMNFLPDVYVHCETCQGKRFNRETLEIRYKGKSIADVLNMSVEDAVVFFDAIPKIKQKIKTLNEVGLNYITLGQQSTTLSGGEAQRVKLATELSKKDTGKTLYILDEPTTGLHFEDVKVLMDVLNTLVDKGNTVLIIEHNLDVIKQADHIIDVGPEGGKGGGTIVAQGTIQEVVKNEKSITGQYLAKEIADETI